MARASMMTPGAEIAPEAAGRWRPVYVLLTIVAAVAVVAVGASTGGDGGGLIEIGDRTPVGVERAAAAQPEISSSAASRSDVSGTPSAAVEVSVEPVAVAEGSDSAAAATVPAVDTAARARAEAAYAAQTGIVPGLPDAAEPRRPQSFERYQVQRGESLYLIATVRGVELADLQEFNPELGDGTQLKVGDWIWIPEWGSDE